MRQLFVGVMIIAFDTYYYEGYSYTVGGVFESWLSSDVSYYVTSKRECIDAEYKSGELYKRELPCIMQCLSMVNLDSIDTIIVDGFVWLSEDGKELTKGLGARLDDAIQQLYCSIKSIIGIAKNPSLDAELAFEDSFGGAIFYQSPNHCHYWNQKANAINSPITLMNYDYAIVELNYVKHFAPRSLLILDEAHNIENKLMATMEVALYNRTLEKDINKRISNETLKDGELSDWKMEIEAIRDSYEDIDLKNVKKNKADRIRSTIARLKTLSNNLEKEPKNWVIDAEETGVVFKPLRVHHYAKDNLLKYGDVVIFMSATILSHKMFSKWLGLNPNEVYHIKVDSPFTKEKRPIILDLAGKMSANRIKNTAPKTISILQEILKKHEGDKGLIHTHSYKCQQYILNNLYNSRLISHTIKFL